MPELWIAAKDCLDGGKTIIADDPGIWAEPIAEFKLPVAVSEQLSATVFVSAQEGGFLVRGTVKGAVTLPCSRCAEESSLELDHSFDSFEPFPASEAEEAEDEAFDMERDESVVRLSPYGPELNVAALIWQETALALPVKPLCTPGCKGLCPKCGVNLNTGSCACGDDEGDPRLAVLRGLRLRQ